MKNVLFGLFFVAAFVVFFRHAEKPEKEFGQLSCQGLNRALALPQVLISKFGKPDHLFAPAPSRRTTATGEEYNYVRPLATIEPTAIRLGLPVNTDYNFTDIDGLCFDSKDYDGIYVVQVTTNGSARSVSFNQDHEKLDNLSTDCPDAK